MSSHAESVFANRSFSFYYAGQALSFVGDGLRLIAIPLLVYHLTGSALSIGITYVLELGPFALFGLLGGSLADRINRRRLMIACDFIRFAIIVVFAVGYATGFLTLPLLYTGIATMAVCAAVFVGAQASTLPYLLGKDRVTRAVSALIAAEQMSNTIIPPIGGAMFGVLGPLPALAINAVTYLCSQVSIAAVDTFGPDEPAGVPSLRDLLSDIAIGFRFLWRDAAMRTISSNSLLFNFFGFMTAGVFIPFLKRDFGATDAAVGWALGIQAIGAVAGSWLAGRVPASWPFGRTLMTAYVLDGLFFIPVMLTHHLWVLVIFGALTNLCVLFEITQIVSWRIRVTPDESVGRVSGAARLVALAGTIPGALIAGVLADHYGARLPIVISGVGYLLIAVVSWLRPALRVESR